MVIKISILIILFYTNLTCFGQTVSESVSSSKQLNTNADTIPNWDMNKTSISIDTLYISKKLIEVDGQTFNYLRKYSPSSNYIEYGNVNSKNIPDGYWMYKLSDDWTPVKGTVSKGHKIGEWGYNCAYICKIRYRWNWYRAKTVISKKKIIYD
jgi:hypothetical protein